MASTIILKHGTGSAVPTSLTQGEAAINIDNGLFYFGSGSGNDVKKLESFTNITASGNISASGTIYADNFQSTGGDVAGISFTDDLNITGDITASGNISASGVIIGLTGSFSQTVVTLKSGAEDSPFIITIADSNGQDNKLEVNKDGVLKMGALDDLPTAVTGGLVYSSSAFYMGL